MNSMMAIEPEKVKVGDMVWVYDPDIMNDGGFFPVKEIRNDGKLVVALGSQELAFLPPAKALIRRFLR